MFKKNKIVISIFLFLFLFCGKTFSKENKIKLDLGLNYNYSSTDSGYYSNQLEGSSNLPKIGVYLLKDKYELGFAINNVTNRSKDVIIKENTKLTIQYVKDKNYYFFHNFKLVNNSYVGYALNYNQSCREVNCIYYYSSNIELKQYFANKNLYIGLSLNPNFMNFTKEDIGSKVILKLSYTPTIYKY